LASVDRVVELENGCVLRDETAQEFAQRMTQAFVGRVA
jgi:hypothetical protein